MFLNRIARPCCYLMDGILMRPSLSIKCAALAVLTAASPAVLPPLLLAVGSKLDPW